MVGMDRKREVVCAQREKLPAHCVSLMLVRGAWNQGPLECPHCLSRWVSEPSMPTLVARAMRLLIRGLYLRATRSVIVSKPG